MKSREDTIHKEACNYIRLKYPGVMFNSDMSGFKLPKGLAIKAKSLRSTRGYPDLAIYESCHGYNACFIEIKKEGVTIYKRNGSIVADKHIQEQAKVHQDLRARNYYATFAVGLDDLIKVIDWYLG